MGSRAHLKVERAHAAGGALSCGKGGGGRCSSGEPMWQAMCQAHAWGTRRVLAAPRTINTLFIAGESGGAEAAGGQVWRRLALALACKCGQTQGAQDEASWAAG